MDSTATGNNKTKDAANEERFDAILQEMNLGEAEAQHLRSLTRLLVGGALVGWDELIARLETWDEGATFQAIDQDGDWYDPSAEDYARVGADYRPPYPQSSNVETLRFALIGLLFETQSRLVDGSQAAFRLTKRTTGPVLSPIMTWMGRSRLLRPARNRFNRLVDRGENEVNRWVERGRTEETRSRNLALTAAEETFGESMGTLASAPELQELIRKQSAGLTQDVVDEVRSRTVTADLILERAARGILGRPTIRRILPNSASNQLVDTAAPSAEEQ